MATFSEPSNPVAPPEYLNVSQQILDTTTPQNHPFAPFPGSPTDAQSSCDIPDTNQFDFFFVPNGAGPITNFQVNLKTPRRIIVLMGNDGGGSAGVILSFVPLSGQQPPTNQDKMVSFAFGSFNAAQSIVAAGGAGTYLRFCKPVTKFFLTAPDSGQPGSNTWFCATDDLDLEY